MLIANMQICKYANMQTCKLIQMSSLAKMLNTFHQVYIFLWFVFAPAGVSDITICVEGFREFKTNKNACVGSHPDVKRFFEKILGCVICIELKKAWYVFGFTINKTGSHQCTRAVCSVFAGIRSTLTPRCIDALSGLEFHFKV